MRNLSLIDRYLARTIAIPLLGTLVLAAMLLVLDKMLRLFDFVVTAGGPVSVVWRMLANLLPEYFVARHPDRADARHPARLPQARFVVGARRAARASGSASAVCYACPICLRDRLDAARTSLIVGYVEPYARYRYEGLRFDLRSGALGAAIKVGEFNQLGQAPDAADRPQRGRGHPARWAFSSQVDDRSGTSVAATAEAGRFLATDDPDTILFRLNNGRLVQESPNFPAPRTLAFDSYDLPINLPARRPLPTTRRRAITN